MPRKKITASPVSVRFVKVDVKARKARETAVRTGAQTAIRSLPHVEERTLESLWHDKKPEGWNFLDWHRAWNGGYPSEEYVELYNEIWTDEPDRQIALIEEEGE